MSHTSPLFLRHVLPKKHLTKYIWWQLSSKPNSWYFGIDMTNYWISVQALHVQVCNEFLSCIQYDDIYCIPMLVMLVVLYIVPRILKMWVVMVWQVSGGDPCACGDPWPLQIYAFGKLDWWFLCRFNLIWYDVVQLGKNCFPHLHPVYKLLILPHSSVLLWLLQFILQVWIFWQMQCSHFISQRARPGNGTQTAVIACNL